MDSLDDTDTGTWQITTESSIYLLDLDRRRMLRNPGAGLGRTDRQGVQVGIADLPQDHQWIPLYALVRCRIGDSLIALTGPHPDGSLTWRVSTLVQDIRMTSPPGGRRRGQAAQQEGHNDEPVFFDRAGNPIDYHRYRTLWADDTYRFLAHDTIGRYEVVTAWLGTDQDPLGDHHSLPLIFGTAALNRGENLELLDNAELFAATEQEALANHARLVERLRRE